MIFWIPLQGCLAVTAENESEYFSPFDTVWPQFRGLTCRSSQRPSASLCPRVSFNVRLQVSGRLPDSRAVRTVCNLRSHAISPVVLRFLKQRRISAFAATACYWVVFATAPRLLRSPSAGLATTSTATASLCRLRLGRLDWRCASPLERRPVTSLAWAPQASQHGGSFKSRVAVSALFRGNPFIKWTASGLLRRLPINTQSEPWTQLKNLCKPTLRTCHR